MRECGSYVNSILHSIAKGTKGIPKKPSMSEPVHVMMGSSCSHAIAMTVIERHPQHARNLESFVGVPVGVCGSRVGLVRARVGWNQSGTESRFELCAWG